MELQNVLWVDDKILAVGFDHKPCITIREILPSDDKAVKKAKKKYPFMVTKDLTVDLYDKRKEVHYHFTIPKGYCYDGASVPRMFWRIIGAPTDNSFLIPALIHDVLCEHKELVNYDRYFADKVFERLLTVNDVSAFKRWLIFHSVDNWQKFQGWGK